MDTIAFARGVPAPEMLPIEELRRASNAAYDLDPHGMLSYGTGAGWLPLRTRIAEQHGVDVARVVVTTGSLHGFVLLAQLVATRAAAEGRTARVIVEQPTYDRPLLVLRQLGIEVIAIDLGPDGVDPQYLDAAMAEGADFAYLIPTFQNPAGATLPLEARRAVLAASRRHAVPILEDDPYGALHFDEPAPATIFELSGQSSDVWYSSSASKTVAPGLRVGWMILPEHLAGEVATSANDQYISSSFLSQATLDRYIDQGSLEPGIDRVRTQLAHRRDILLDALHTHLPDARLVTPGGGYFAWVELPDALDAGRVAQAALVRGASVVDGASFGEACTSHVRVAFSSPPVEQIERGVKRLAQAINDVRVPS